MEPWGSVMNFNDATGTLHTRYISKRVSDGLVYLIALARSAHCRRITKLCRGRFRDGEPL